MTRPEKGPWHWVLAVLTASPVLLLLVSVDAAAFWAGARALTWALRSHPVFPPLLCFGVSSARAWWRANLTISQPAGAGVAERLWIGATGYAMLVGGCWLAAWVLR